MTEGHAACVLGFLLLGRFALYALTATITPRSDRMCAAMRGQCHTFMENAHVEL